MLVLVHYSRSHPITTSSHSMATLLLVYFTLTQTFPLSPLQTPHSHPLWWIFLSLPWLKTGFSLKTSFLWSCSWLTPPVLEIRKLCPDSSFIYCRWKPPFLWSSSYVTMLRLPPSSLSLWTLYYLSSVFRSTENIMPSLWHAIIIPDNPCHKYWPGFPHLQLCFKRFLSFLLSRYHTWVQFTDGFLSTSATLSHGHSCHHLQLTQLWNYKLGQPTW